MTLRIAALKCIATTVAVVAFVLLTDVAQALRPANAGLEPRATTEGAQSGNDLFQQALSKERAEGKLEEAIQLYERIVKEFAADRALAAKALLQLGLCYERLGRKDDAQRAFKAVATEYADQSDAARRAQASLSAITDARQPRTLITRQVWTEQNTDNTGRVLGAPSPNGRFIAYTDWDTGGLAIRDLATGERRRIMTGFYWPEFAYSPRVSPDSRQIAYQWYLRGGKDAELRVVDLDSSRIRTVYRNPEVPDVDPVDWSPDGKYILAIFARHDLTNQLALVSVADGAARILKSMDWRRPGHPSFSPDGRFVAYDFPPKDTSPERDVFLLSTDGTREVPLIEHPANDLMLGWAPDGAAILFSSDRTGSVCAWIMRMSGRQPHGLPELVKRDLGRVDPIGFSRSGSFYYGVRTGMRDVYTAALDFESGKLLEPPAPVDPRFLGTNSAPAWSPDGQHLAYLSSRDSSPPSRIISIRSLGTGQVRQVVTPTLPAPYRMSWFHDGRFLLIEGSDDKGRWGFWQVDAGTAEVKLLLLGGEGSNQRPTLSTDGRSVVFSRNESGPQGQALIRREFESGAEQELYRTTGLLRAHTFSPDGQSLAFFDSDPRGGAALKLMKAVGGQPREIVTGRQFGVNALAWTPDGRSLIFGNFWRIGLDGGEPQKLGLSMEQMQDLQIHPDGRRVVFVGGENKGELWVMENFLPGVKTDAVGSRRSGAKR